VRHSLAIAVAVVAALVTCAWLQAGAFNALVAAGLASSPPPAPRSAQAAARETPSPADRSADAILARNPFDSKTGPLGPPSAAPGSNDDAAGAPGPATCDDVRLAVIVQADDPDDSMAMLEVRGEREPILRRQGGEIVRIGWDRVVLDRGGSRCTALLFAPPRADATGQPPPAKPAGANGIERTGASSFAVDRAARDALFESGADLMRAVSVRPEKRGDQVVGMRIVALKPGTPLDALGVRAGDVLESVDGMSLGSPESLLGVLARLHTAEHVRLTLLRDGHESQVDYDVR
jgi:general secretion pathway protein C